jgi:hypothetical protein
MTFRQKTLIMTLNRTFVIVMKSVVKLNVVLKCGVMVSVAAPATALAENVGLG